MPLWEQVKRNLVEWYTIAADKTEEVAKVGVRRYDRFGISRDIERQFAELGSLVYEALSAGRRDVLEDPALRAIVERVGRLERELAEKEREIDDIRREHRQRAATRERTEGEPGGGAGPEPGAPAAPGQEEGAPAGGTPGGEDPAGPAGTDAGGASRPAEGARDGSARDPRPDA